MAAMTSHSNHQLVSRVRTETAKRASVEALRRVAKVSRGVFVEPQIFLSAGGALTRGGPGVCFPGNF